MVENIHRRQSPLDALELACALSELNEVYLALEVLVSAIKISQNASFRSRDYWSLLADLINKVAVLEAAEKAYEITSFLDRFGIQVDDEVYCIDNSRRFQMHDSEVDWMRRQAIDHSNQSESCDLASSYVTDRKEIEPRPDESRISSESCSSSRSNASKYWSGLWKLFNIFARKPSYHSSAGVTTARSVMRLRRRSPRVTQTQWSDVASSLGHFDGFSVMTESCQELSQSKSTRDCALWAISECEILGCSRMSEASTTSVEATDNNLVGDTMVKRSSQLGIIRFFRSFVLSESK